MTRDDPRSTRRHQTLTVAVELAAAGFSDAEEVGRGGFGIVYRCTQPGLDRVVAVKVLTADLPNEGRTRFVREQQAMGRLTGHPHIVTILQVGTTENDHPYIVMEFIPGDSLDTMLRKRGPLGLEEVLHLGVKLAGALETAHYRGILHRDVKPGNILITEYGEPVLTDFGISHIAGGFETATGVVTGSPAYTAPEVLKGSTSSPASDLYGLGATLFSALTGHAAFERRSGEQVISQFLRIATLPAPDLLEHGAPSDVSEAIGRAMSTDPKKRHSSIEEFGNELRLIQHRHQFFVDNMSLQTNKKSDPENLGEIPEPLKHSTPQRNDIPKLSERYSKGNLPSELTRFVGRRNETAVAKKNLASNRLLTLTGIGGVGKTRLALHVAGAVQRSYANGVWFVQLGELRDPSLVADVVAAALNVRNGSAQNMQAALAEFIDSQELLLVIDNCEQVVESAARLIAALLRKCGNLRILATSREPLGVSGESLIQVPPLSSPDPDHATPLKGMANYDSVILFADRASVAVPTFEITDSNKDTISRICRRLDGLPLAIELAAARLRGMSVEQILERLTDRYALLTRGGRTSPTRQQTLRQCIDWSFDLCTAREQLMWARTSIFAGSFELDAAEHVCGSDLTPDEVTDLVSSLVDKSILIRESSGTAVRFRMLEALIEYGRAKLEAGGDYLMQKQRHLDWYEQLVTTAQSEWISSQQVGWIARLEREQTNLREALELGMAENPDAGLRMAASLFHFWHARGIYGEGRRWLDRLLMCQTNSRLNRIKALYANSILAGIQGATTAARESVRAARNLTAHTHDPTSLALVELTDGSLKVIGGDFAEARLLIEKSVLDLVQPEMLTYRIAALHMLGIAYEQMNDSVRALSYHDQVLALTRTRGEAVYQAYSLWWIAFATWGRGERDKSIRMLEDALRLVRQVNNPSSAATGLELLAWIRADQRTDYRRAVVLMGAADELARSVGTTPVIFQDLRRVQHAKCEEKTRNALGKQQYEASFKEGRLLGLPGAIAYALSEPTPPAQQSDETADLTKRERQVAGLVSEGLTNKEIASRLVISPRTAQGHVEHILVKLGFTSRTQIATWVIEHADTR
ncbi:protein kinase domain-containing protein [Rhodococcus globerulus]|uniref:Protein kinase n=1 Tax=Rhodococcus globerulus TaxID=33008 RepID=A0ABU4C4Q0_RHOGO|nr:protein kinase [Rhodococcus globerulus]MDV6271482.1 protein kinase [Rhodococcus globerulus]